MRGLSLVLVGAMLASCASDAQQPMRSAKNEQRYQSLLAGKVAQAPISCIPPYRSNDMVVIDEQTLVFQSGTGRAYVAHMQGPCNLLNAGPYALVTREYGGSGLCRGDIGRVVDTLNGVTVGSCVFGDFVPYVRGGGRY